MIVKGFKTSELWVVVFFLAQQFLPIESIGDLTETQRQVQDIANQLHADGVSGTGATWLAIIYVLGRIALKWKETNSTKRF